MAASLPTARGLLGVGVLDATLYGMCSRHGGHACLLSTLHPVLLLFVVSMPQLLAEKATRASSARLKRSRLRRPRRHQARHHRLLWPSHHAARLVSHHSLKSSQRNWSPAQICRLLASALALACSARFSTVCATPKLGMHARAGVSRRCIFTLCCFASAVVGGDSGGGYFVDSMETFNGSAWASVASMPTARSFVGVGVLGTTLYGVHSPS